MDQKYYQQNDSYSGSKAPQSNQNQYGQPLNQSNQNNYGNHQYSQEQRPPPDYSYPNYQNRVSQNVPYYEQQPPPPPANDLYYNNDYQSSMNNNYPQYKQNKYSIYNRNPMPSYGSSSTSYNQDMMSSIPSLKPFSSNDARDLPALNLDQPSIKPNNDQLKKNEQHSRKHNQMEKRKKEANKPSLVKEEDLKIKHKTQYMLPSGILKFQVSLPKFPSNDDLKIVKYPIPLDRFSNYFTTSLEKKRKYPLLTDIGLGVDFNLVDPKMYKTEPSFGNKEILEEREEMLDIKDRELIMDEKLFEQLKKQKNIEEMVENSGSVDFASNDKPFTKSNKQTFAVPNKTSNKKKPIIKPLTKVGPRRLNIPHHVLYSTSNDQVTEIEKTFAEVKKYDVTSEEEKKKILHPSNPGVYLEESFSVLPSLRDIGKQFVQIQFNVDPTPKSKYKELYHQSFDSLPLGEQQRLKNNTPSSFFKHSIVLEDTPLDDTMNREEKNKNYLSYYLPEDPEQITLLEKSNETLLNEQDNEFDEDVIFRRVKSFTLKEKKEKESNFILLDKENKKALYCPITYQYNIEQNNNAQKHLAKNRVILKKRPLSEMETEKEEETIIKNLFNDDEENEIVERFLKRRKV